MAIAERANAYLWTTIDLRGASILVWECDDHGLAARVRHHVVATQSNAQVLTITGGAKSGLAIIEQSSLEHGSIDCAVLSFSARSFSFTSLLVLLHKIHLLLRTGGRLVIRMDSLQTGPSPDLRWWDRRNRLTKAVASLAGEGQGAELTSDELVKILQVIGFGSIQPMTFHGEALSPVEIRSLVEEVTRYASRMETANWRQAITDELQLLRQQLETERGYTNPVAIIDATKQAKQ